MIAKIKQLFRSWRRWHYANNKGLALVGKMIRAHYEHGHNSFQVNFFIRNSNRLYRLTHYGNPWKKRDF